MSHEHRVYYIPLFIHLKHMVQESRGKCDISFSICAFWFRAVTSMKELLDSCVILQVECQK
jgi:hypothetical protein